MTASKAPAVVAPRPRLEKPGQQDSRGIGGISPPQRRALDGPPWHLVILGSPPKAGLTHGYIGISHAPGFEPGVGAERCDLLQIGLTAIPSPIVDRTGMPSSRTIDIPSSLTLALASSCPQPA